jgi:nicotinamide riboside kinase
MYKKIAISGTEGVGKTLLADEVGKRYGVPVIPEFARETAADMGIKNLRELTPQKTLMFQTNLLERKIREESRHQIFIADRSTADNMAYYLRWCSRDIHDAFNSSYVRICRDRLANYDHVVVLPWGGIPLEPDGFRTSKLYYQYEIHCLILGILQDYDVPHTVLKEKDLEKRIQYFDRFFVRTGPDPVTVQS